MSLGAMGLVSAVSGVGAVVIPLTVAVTAFGSRVSGGQLLGVLFAMAAVAAASGATRQGVSRLSLSLALLAALGFGGWFVLIDRAAVGNQLWALVAARGSATLLVGGLAVARGEGAGLRRAGPLVILAGLLDAGANGLVVLAFASVGVGVAAALSGTYPLFTMLLARLLLGERLPRLGVAAVVLGVTGIVLISLGG
jgi:drug/metabolite transporter (DMT)-like permease